MVKKHYLNLILILSIICLTTGCTMSDLNIDYLFRNEWACDNKDVKYQVKELFRKEVSRYDDINYTLELNDTIPTGYDKDINKYTCKGKLTMKKDETQTNMHIIYSSQKVKDGVYVELIDGDIVWY